MKIGIAYTCSYMWERPDTRTRATDMLIRLLESGAGVKLGKAILRVFDVMDTILPDEDTHRLLEALSANPWALEGLSDGRMLEHLQDLLPQERDSVHAITAEIVRLHGKKASMAGQHWYYDTHYLTNIAITLHRMEEPYRAKGLSLFESLLNLDIYDAKAALREYDLRPPGREQGQVRPRLRRRRAGRRS